MKEANAGHFSSSVMTAFASLIPSRLNCFVEHLRTDKNLKISLTHPTVFSPKLLCPFVTSLNNLLKRGNDIFLLRIKEKNLNVIP